MLLRTGLLLCIAASAGHPAFGAGHDHHAGHGAQDPHLRLTAAREATAADETRYDALTATIRRELGRYQDVGLAVADGYEPFLPGVKQRQVHYTKRAHALLAMFGFDPVKPTSLLYQREPDGSLTLTGVMYTAPYWLEAVALDERVPLAIAPWHQHINLCLPRRGERSRWQEMDNGQPLFGPKSAISTEAGCEAIGGRFVDRLFGWMVHVEAFPPPGIPHQTGS